MKTSRTSTVRSIIALAALSLTGTLAASSASATALNYGSYDTRSAGAFAAVATPSNDGDGSLQMQTFDATSNGKVSVAFYNQPGQSLGTLGSINQLMVDYMKASSPATGATNQFAYRLQMSPGGTTALVWENNYNGNAVVPTDSFQNDFSLLSGNFWERGNGTNFNGGSQAQPLSYWSAGNAPTTDANGNAATAIAFNANSPVYALEIAFGSGVGAFTGYVDDVKIGFAGGDNYASNVVAPEPTSLTAVAAAAGLVIRRRRTI